MYIDFSGAQQELQQELSSLGHTLDPSAAEPLRHLDYQRLVSIYDHEEAFLRRVLVRSIVTAHRARVQRQGSPPQPVSEDDVRTGMLMFGAAVANAPDQTFSKASTSVIQDICPYC